MNLPDLMVLFARVVEAGSFSAASRELDHSPSAVSKQIAHLEDRVGVRLLQRSKAGVTLTEDGEAFYAHCAEIRRRVGAAEELVMSFGDHPSGLLHVSSTVAFGKSQLMPVLPKFLAENPDVRISLDLTDRQITQVEDHVDVAIKFTEQVLDESQVARKIAHNSRVLCAAPAYIETNGMPKTPEDLKRHNCLRLSSVAQFNHWSFGELEDGKMTLSGNFEANSADALYHAALAGTGIVRLSSFLVNDDLRTGRLFRVLPEYRDDSSDIFAIYAARKNLPPKVRAFIDFLVREFLPIPPWERENPDFGNQS